jgi:hypothetical protein
MKEDERQLFIDFYNESQDGRSARDVVRAAAIYINQKRAWRLFEKWGKKGYVECGVSIGACWLTDKGWEKGKELLIYKSLH